MSRILVVGSSNTDMVVRSPHIPVPGETVLGGKFFMNPGGKGANQAVAAARLGGEVTFLTKIGKDLFGTQAVKGFEKEGINTRYIAVSESEPSGVASIVVGDTAENSIVVAPGANYDLNKADIDLALTAFIQTQIVLVQLEIPIEIVEYVIEMGKRLNKKVILNPAPAQKLSDNSLASLFAVTPNESEAELLTGVKVSDEKSASKAAGILTSKGIENVIITMGSKGAYLYSESVKKMIPGYKVNAVDTTAAGDTFNGALAVALLEGIEMEEAIVFANKAAAIAVTRPGAQSGIPFLADVNSFSE